jgi:hypothetical protein
MTGFKKSGVGLAEIKLTACRTEKRKPPRTRSSAEILSVSVLSELCG